eukprot:ANDGO_07591.mRNA.1 hypothetical protein SAMD00019534_050550
MSSLMLAQFCDKEGPSVIFCTQYQHPSSHSSTTPTSTPTPTPTPTTSTTAVITSSSSSSLFSEDSVLEKFEFQTGPFVSGTRIKPQYVPQSKSMCQRAFSGEHIGNQEGEGPVIFGNSHSGYILTYVFRLGDDSARGFAQRFAFLVLDPDCLMLVHRWQWLVDEFASIVNQQWKPRCPEIPRSNFDGLLVAPPSSSSSSSSFYTPAAASNTAPALAPAPPTAGATNSPAKRYHGPAKASRPLDEVLQIADFWREMHIKFTYISESLRSAFSLSSAVYSPQLPLFSTPSHLLLPSSSLSVSSLSSSSTSCVEVETTLGQMFRGLVKNLEVRRVRGLVWWVMCGNQVVVTGKNKSEVCAVVHGLSLLVPEPCRSVCYYATQYRPSYEFAFLGLSDIAELQLPFDPALCMVLDWDNHAIVFQGPDPPDSHLALDGLWSILMNDSLSLRTERLVLDVFLHKLGDENS